jgi:hypothetical protein
MAMQGRRLSRTEVIAWNKPWNTRDRVRVTAAIDSIPDAVYIVPPADGGHIGVWTNNRRALVIYPGYLVWPGGRGVKALPPDLFSDMEGDGHDEWVGLSTFEPRTGGPRIPELAAAICPVHFVELPQTGVCDSCV